MYMLYNYNNYTHQYSNVQGRSVRFARGGLTSETIPQIYTPAPGRPLPSLFPKKLIFYRTDNVSRFRSTFHSFSPYFIILIIKTGTASWQLGPRFRFAENILCSHRKLYTPIFPLLQPPPEINLFAFSTQNQCDINIDTSRIIVGRMFQFSSSNSTQSYN